MDEEYNSLITNQTWELVPLPSNCKLVRCKWICQTKKLAYGQVSRYKERLVAKGFQQVQDIDNDETFSPVEKNGFHFIGSYHCNIKKVGDLSHGCEEFFSSWWSWGGDLYGAATRVCTWFILSMQAQEMTLWPQESTSCLVWYNEFLSFVSKF